ncbi:uncharacterized protein C2orf50-like isoform X1 [Pomacea canaliculata]|uniref:uncharacterized protein C2orf50-like isoform X1 n=1 Tax=Pomacea canaliculata TaxID=400727 RepID=UPI000D7335B8|nr:uncharacterized protein C2orf50-like isoform X1 [Pomacea canaliculata]
MQRQTSGLLFSYINKSNYHDNCIPRQNTAAQLAAETSKPHNEGEYRACDLVTQDKIWKQSVASERRCLENWSENWAFLTEYDSKGNVVEKEELPEKISIFSENVPNTNSGNYGCRHNTEPAKMMQNMEFKFYSDRRRRKMGSDMVCY